MLPTFTFDLRATEDFDKLFGDEVVADRAAEAMMYEPEPDADYYRDALDEFVGDDDLDAVVLALTEGLSDKVVLPYPIDEIRQAFQDALQYAYERVYIIDDSAIESALTEAIGACAGEEMYGVLTDMYWCGVLASWPWAEITTDEDAVTSAVLAKAKVKGSTYTLTYRGTEYARKLLKIARRDDSDLGFGGNSEMELGTIARYVRKEAIARLEQLTAARGERGIDVRSSDIRENLQRVFTEVNA